MQETYNLSFKSEFPCKTSCSRLWAFPISSRAERNGDGDLEGKGDWGGLVVRGGGGGGGNRLMTTFRSDEEDIPVSSWGTERFTWDPEDCLDLGFTAPGSWSGTSTPFGFVDDRREGSVTANCSNLERKLLTACNGSPSIAEGSIVEVEKSARRSRRREIC